MKQLTLPQQRELYKAYKETRIHLAYDSMAIMKTGAENSEESLSILRRAKDDILKFSSVFEEKLLQEIETELDSIR